jgi:2,4-dienoyl-CoA reductase-like NADH-dependent reductase (Old Yellow Enzyme family)
MINVSDALTLPCGATLKNRIGKAAMTEGLADAKGVPTGALERLYRLWAEGGAGLLLSGNIQIDRDHLERPGNVIMQGKPSESGLAALRRLASAGTQNDTHFWAQISHGGRQTQAVVNPHPKAPSSVKLGLPGGQFGQPEALEETEIQDLIKRFAAAAKLCKDVGFTGVQVHAAHGYLISSFLSPRANRRDDQWGGALENRARFLLETVKQVRALVGPGFPVAVKLNSADFQRGGFSFDESLQVAKWLQQAGIDLLEISGGSYEQPKLLGIEGLEAPEQQNVAASTLQREAYFVDFAKAMRAELSLPLMVTGGFRSCTAMQEALASGAVDVIGLGRPMCVWPDAPNRLLAGEARLPSPEKQLRLLPGFLAWLKRFPSLRAVDGFATQFWFYAQIYALGESGQGEEISVWKAYRRVERRHKRLLAERRSSN